LSIARANGVMGILHGALSAAGLAASLPRPVIEALAQHAARRAEQAQYLGDALRLFLRRAAERDLQVVVLKGLWLSSEIYGHAALRPGADIDLLVRKQEVARCLEILEELGFDRWSPDLFDDRFYARHHLHQQRSSKDLRILFEVHWAFDHPYNLLTIDYDELLKRTSAGSFLGEVVLRLSLPDLLLSLAIHLVKHAVYLPSALERLDLPRVILADGRLLHFLDIVELLKEKGHEIDWEQTVRLAQDWNAMTPLGSVLRVSHAWFDSAIPPHVLDALPPARPSGLTSWVMRQVIAQQVAAFRGQALRGPWRALLGMNQALILRPVRLLDLAAYTFPPAGFLRRRYGSSSPWCGVGHAARAVGQYAGMVADTLYYGLLRNRRRKAHRPSTALKPGLGR